MMMVMSMTTVMMMTVTVMMVVAREAGQGEINTGEAARTKLTLMMGEGTPAATLPQLTPNAFFLAKFNPTVKIKEREIKHNT